MNSGTQPKIDLKKTEVLSDNHYVLNKVTYDYEKSDGTVEEQVREVYDKGSGAALFLYNKEKNTIILTRQFRIPIYINEGEENGMSVEVCAGLLEGLLPEECAKKEALEETGYKIEEINYLFEAYMTPGAVMEKVYFFAAQYTPEMKVEKGGGLVSEQEEIEILELDLDEAYDMIFTGEITDGKTIMLLQHAKLVYCLK